MLPNFLIIGAAKSGTYSLWTYLNEHPQVFMARTKELDFFCRPDWREQLDWYEEQFREAGEPVRGEASVYYSMHPFKPDVASSVHELLPDARLIYMVRDPVPRAISGYVQNVAVGYEKRPINEAFANLDDPANEYVCSSRYARQLREYLRFFPKERIYVGDQADLRSCREQAVSRIFRFLGVDDSFRSERFAEIVNPRENQVRITKVGWRLRTTPAAHWIRRLPPSIGTPLANTARLIFDRRLERYPQLDPALREGLAERLRPEVEELREMTGLPLDSWTI